MPHTEFDFLYSPLFWIMAAALCMFTVTTIPALRNPLERISEKLGTANIPLGYFFVAGTVWFILLAAFLFGVFHTLIALFNVGLSETKDQFADLRWTLLTLAAAMGALSAVIALPFTLIRTKQNGLQTERALQQTDIAQKQADIAEQGHITDRINTAVLGLGAEKTVKRPGASAEVTEPNLEVRIGAIYALERIAQDSPRDHVQIMEILCAYIRHNAPAHEAEEPPEYFQNNEKDGDLPEDWLDTLAEYKSTLADWTPNLKPRDDIQVALTVIGRRSDAQCLLEARAHGGAADAPYVFDTPCPDYPADGDTEAIALYPQEFLAWQTNLRTYAGYRLDLHNTNLQGADLSTLKLQGARFDDARMQGTSLKGAQMQGADFRRAHLQGAKLTATQIQLADLSDAWMQGAILWATRIQGAILWDAQIQGASLLNVQMQETELIDVKMQGAELKGTQMQGATLWRTQMQGAQFMGVEMNKTTKFQDTDFCGTYLSAMDFTNTAITPQQIMSAFGDATVALPNGITPSHPDWPTHWPQEELDISDFHKAYQAWLAKTPSTPPSNSGA